MFAKRREFYRAQLKDHMQNIFNEHKNNRYLNKRAALLKLLEVSYSWRVEVSKLSEISNKKFMHHLKNHGAELVYAKKRIKELLLQQLELRVKAKRYL